MKTYWIDTETDYADLDSRHEDSLLPHIQEVEAPDLAQALAAAVSQARANRVTESGGSPEDYEVYIMTIQGARLVGTMPDYQLGGFEPETVMEHFARIEAVVETLPVPTEDTAIMGDTLFDLVISEDSARLVSTPMLALGS